MALYCMCEDRDEKALDHQHFMAPNRYCAVESSRGGTVSQHDIPPLALYTQMVLLKIGADQVLLDGGKRPNDWSTHERPSDWRNHYPNVDFYECPICGARIARG